MNAIYLKLPLQLMISYDNNDCETLNVKCDTKQNEHNNNNNKKNSISDDKVI